MIRFNEEKQANEIALVEIFSSLNGEGHSAGMPTVFIRTLGCNLRCQFGCCLKEGDLFKNTCDTPESLSLEHFKSFYEGKDPIWMTAQELYDKVLEMEKDWYHKSICLTGGEPLMEDNKDFMIKELLPLFIKHHFDTSIETNGGIDYSDYKKAFGKARIVDGYGNREGLTIIADYKLPSSKMSSLMKDSNFAIYDDTDLIKMVISDDEKDWKKLDDIIEAKTKAQLYISPMWGKVDTEKMWNYACNHPDRQVKVQLQLHKYFFQDPNEKGV